MSFHNFMPDKRFRKGSGFGVQRLEYYRNTNYMDNENVRKLLGIIAPPADYLNPEPRTLNPAKLPLNHR
jgi:hypothetical protein